MTMFADIVWWVMASAAALGFLASVVECILVLEFIHTGRIPHVFAQEYKISTSLFIGVTFLHIIALLFFFLFPAQLNILYETRTFFVWLYVVVMNSILIASYALPQVRDLRGVLGEPHRVVKDKEEQQIRKTYVGYTGMIVAHSLVLFFSYFHIFDQIPSTHILAMLIIMTLVSGVVMPLVYRLRISLKNNL